MKSQVRAGFVRGSPRAGSGVRCPHHVCGHCLGRGRDRPLREDQRRLAKVYRTRIVRPLSQRDPEVNLECRQDGINGCRRSQSRCRRSKRAAAMTVPPLSRRSKTRPQMVAVHQRPPGDVGPGPPVFSLAGLCRQPGARSSASSSSRPSGAVSIHAFDRCGSSRSSNLMAGNVAPARTWSLAWCSGRGGRAAKRYCALTATECWNQAEDSARGAPA
jgi:hypothetical protein